MIDKIHNNMRIQNNKGFTMIELMVVISIIGLLSSIVLASLKDAKDKAMITKTVAEMKSLQTAVEMYKNQFGKYPGEDLLLNYDDDDKGNCCSFSGSASSIESFFKTELVNRKFITKVPHAPNYPNNCSIEGCYNGYVLGYSTYDSVSTEKIHSKNNDPDEYFTCGTERVKNYIIYFYANSKKINLPLLNYYYFGDFYNLITYDTNSAFYTEPPYVYCLSM